MASQFLRRSGVAVGLICERLGWKPDEIYQVGIGQHHEEVDVLHQEWPDAKWVGFEPHPDIVKSLTDYPGSVVEVALNNFVGKDTLQFKRNHKDGSSLFEHRNQENVDKVEVKVSTLDTLYHALSNEPKKRMLWLDCEGSELRVLQGGSQSFIDWIDVINVEMTSNPAGEGWGASEDVHKLLEGAGFWLQWIHTNRSVVGQCDCVYVRSGLFNPKYCCVPHEKIRWNDKLVRALNKENPIE